MARTLILLCLILIFQFDTPQPKSDGKGSVFDGTKQE